MPDPNLNAINISLRNPKNLLPNVNIIIIKVDFATLFCIDITIPPEIHYYNMFRSIMKSYKVV